MNIRHDRRRPVRTVVAAGLLAVSTMVAVAVTPQVAHAQSPLKYVALGDSYSAGPLDGPTTGNLLCLQSSASYPYDTASYLGASLDDVSCSAATSADLVNTSQYPGVSPQVDALSSSTQLVTLTDGGNDNGLFVSAILDCGITDILDVFNIGSPCKDLYGNTFTNDVSADAVDGRADVRDHQGRRPECANLRPRLPRYPPLQWGLLSDNAADQWGHVLPQ